jgi:hypothetical protein
MDRNESGLGFEIEFEGRFQPGEEEPQHGRRLGRTYVHTCRYAQLGRASGWIDVDGTRFDVDDVPAQRDHSWGVRMGVGAPEQGVQEPDVAPFIGMMINWLTVQFGSWGVYLYYIERMDGSIERLSGSVVGLLDDGTGPIPVTGVEHEFAYHEGGARMRSGRMTLTLADGTTRELSMRQLTTMYLRGGGYLGCKGVTHGLWMGPSWSDGETWNVADPRDADEVHGLDDTVVEVACGSETGHGIIENLILPPFPRYGF